MKLIAAFLIAASALGAGQAELDWDTTLHVAAAAHATDRNNGAAATPLATIGEAARRALANRRQGRSTRVLIHPGMYRESIELTGSEGGATEPAIAFEAVLPGRAIVTGSDRFTDWQPSTEPGIYRHPWVYRWGLARLPDGWDLVRGILERQPIVRRGEMVFVDGILLQQVLSLGELRGQPGAFYVEETTDRESGSLWINPPAGRAMDEAEVEVAVRPALLVATRLSKLTIRGLVFQHASTLLQDAAVRLNGCTNAVIEDTRFVWNNWNGLALNEVHDVTVRRVEASHNGAGGLGSWRARRLVVEDVDVSGNNWRGNWGGFTSWATGQKFFHLREARFTRFRAVGNHATGLWFDTDHADVTIDGARLCDNERHGLVIEAVQGPFILRNSTICRNRESGIFVTAAAAVTLTRNTIAGNRAHQISIPWLAAEHALRQEVDYETRQPIAIETRDWTLSENTIGGDGDSLLLSVGNWGWFFRTLQSTGNRWSHTKGPDAFGVYLRMHAAPSRLDLAGWREFSGQDRNSSFSGPVN